MPLEDHAESRASFDDAYDNNVVEDAVESTPVEGLTDEPETTEENDEATGETADEATEEEDEPSEEEADPYKDGAEKGSDEYDDLVKQIAKRMKKDLNDPEQRKDVQTVVDAQLHIRKLQRENKQLREGRSDEDATLTEFEKGLLENKKEPEDKAAEEKKPQARSDGFNWTGPKDAYSDELKAWQEQDFNKLHNIREELAARTVQSLLMSVGPDGEANPSPVLSNLIGKVIQQNIGGILPQMQQIVATNSRNEAKNLAIADVEKIYPDLREMFVEDGGQPIVDENGNKLPNTPLNRVLNENPELLDIYVQHNDPQTADRLTYTKLLKAARRIHAKEKGGTKKDKRLLEAGIKTGQRTEQERSRQSLNKGSGATATAGAGRKSYVDQLMEGRGRRLGDF